MSHRRANESQAGGLKGNAMSVSAHPPSVAWLSIATVLALLPAGCGQPLEADYSSLNLATVSGTVTQNGKPLTGVSVIFEAQDLTHSYGRTNDSGQYELMFNSTQEGITPGTKTVRITYPTADTAGGEEADPDAEPPVDAKKIPARYNTRSELSVEIAGGQSHVFDFDLSR